MAWASGEVATSGTVTWRGWSVPGGGPIGRGVLWAGDVGWRPWQAPSLFVQLQGSWQVNRVQVEPAAVLAERWGVAVLPPEAGALGVACGLGSWRAGRVVLGGSVWGGVVWPDTRPAYRVQGSIAVDVMAGGTLSVEGFTGDDPLRGVGDRGMSMSFVNHFWM
jgi:hypothetical protein